MMQLRLIQKHFLAPQEAMLYRPTKPVIQTDVSVVISTASLIHSADRLPLYLGHHCSLQFGAITEALSLLGSMK